MNEISKKISSNRYFVKLFIFLLTSILFIEGVFKQISFHNLFVIESLRIIIYTVTLSLFLAFIYSFLKPALSKLLVLSTVFIIGLYAVTQMGFQNFMGNYMSLNATGDGAGRIGEYIFTFIKYIRLEYYICFLPFILLLILFKKNKKYLKHHPKTRRGYLVIIMLLILFQCLSYLTLELKMFDNPNQIKTNKELYNKPVLFDLSLKQFGSTRFMWLDFMYMVNPGKDNTSIIIDDKEPTKPIKTNYSRVIDDTAWKAMIASETNPTLNTLNKFYINQSITPKNDMTGFFKDKNFIMIMIEAFDMVAINETLTPTLYKMAHQGWYYDNYYTPKYSCTTGESEYIALTSIVPIPTECVPNYYTNNNYETSMFNLFKLSNYYNTSYHNWTDKYYNRTDLHYNMGSLKFYNFDDLNIKNILGWPSDLNLMQEAVPHFINEDKFFTFIITSTTHFPYDEITGVVKDHWNLVKDLSYPDKIKSYLAKAIELDHALAYLLQSLKDKGILDDTVIALFGDHHPLNMGISYLNQASSIDRFKNFNIDRLPFIIYNSKLTPTTYSKVASTFDILPTVANLFDLKYDPRYYTGKDYFSDEETTVIFTNGSWITNRAMYFASNGTNEKTDPTVNDAYIQAVNKRVSDYMYVSEKTLRLDYFKYRFKK